MTKITFEHVVGRVRDHADAESLFALGTILSYEGLESEASYVIGRGETLLIKIEDFSGYARIWREDSMMGFGDPEWVVASGTRRNYIKKGKNSWPTMK